MASVLKQGVAAEEVGDCRASLSLNIDNHVSEPSPFSPQTPSSMFAKSVIADSKGCIVKAFLLCYWDNILGPRIRHLWLSENCSDWLTLEALNYVANHTLSGEICRDPTNAHVDTKLYVVRERDMAVNAFVFGAMGVGDLGIHSLSVILPCRDLRLFLHWEELSRNWLHRGVTKLRIKLERSGSMSAMLVFTDYLSQYAQMLKSLREAAVPQNIPLSDTAFHPEHHFEQTFVRRAVFGHLMSCGHSVIVGNNVAQINLMIATLAMFVSPRERMCCRYASPEHPWGYHTDLNIQGLLLGQGKDLSMTLKDIYFSRYPTTLIDLGSEEVKMSSLPHQHVLQHHQACTQEVMALWRGHQHQSYPTSDMFHIFDDPETLVKNFTEELHELPPGGGCREAYFSMFIQLLNRKAMALIKYIETHNATSKTAIHLHVRKLRHDLALNVPGDFHIVLAAAEKMKPGIYAFVLGDPKLRADYAANLLDPF